MNAASAIQRRIAERLEARTPDPTPITRKIVGRASGDRRHMCQHASGLVMPIDLQAAANEYIGWLQLEANRSPNTVRAYEAELKKLIIFLHESGHTLQLADLRHEDLRAYQRRLATRLKSPASRARALVAVRSWLRWVAREGFIDRDLSTESRSRSSNNACRSP